MDALSYMRSSVERQSVTCDVLRGGSRGYNGGDYSKADVVDVAIFAPSSSSIVTVEGNDEDTSLTGLVVPDYDSNGDLDQHVEVNDRLRPQSNEAKKYDVRVKEGLPNDLDPTLWRLGLEHANQSQ